jgi:hypothetical protein
LGAARGPGQIGPGRGLRFQEFHHPLAAEIEKLDQKLIRRLSFDGIR